MEKIKSFAYLSLAILGGGLIIFLFMKYVFGLMLPFLIAWAIAFLMRPPARFFHRYIKLPERIIRLVLTLLCTVLLLALLGVGIWRLSEELWRFFQGVGEEGIESVISRFTSSDGLFGSVFGKFGDTVGEAIYNLVISLLESLGRLISSWVGMLPRAFLFLIVTLISCVYFSLDLELINGAIGRMLPPRALSVLRKIKGSIAKVGGRYLRSYFLILLITFATLVTGFLILRVPYALLVAVLISLLDILPIFGVGTALIPWSIYQFVFGNSRLGIGLLVVYAVHTVIRQFAEPKILGKNLGIHPILTLVFLYVGYSLFGFIGIIIAPIFTVLFNIPLDKKNAAEVTEPPTRQSDDS